MAVLLIAEKRDQRLFVSLSLCGSTFSAARRVTHSFSSRNMNTLGRQLSAASTRAARDCRRRRWNVCATALPGTSSRSVHTRRELHYPIEEGVGEFLPPPALKTVVEWQEGLLERFNDQVRGTSKVFVPDKPSMLNDL